MVRDGKYDKKMLYSNKDMKEMREVERVVGSYPEYRILGVAMKAIREAGEIYLREGGKISDLGRRLKIVEVYGMQEIIGLRE